jgi:hypothetical protein
MINSYKKSLDDFNISLLVSDLQKVIHGIKGSIRVYDEGVSGINKILGTTEFELKLLEST